MSATISRTTTAKGAIIEVVRRARRTCIETAADGRVRVIAEQEDVTYVDDVLLPGSVDAGAVVIPHDEVVANPDFPAVKAAIVAALDSKRAAIEDAKAAAIAAEAARLEAEADAEPVVIEDGVKP